MQIKQEMQIISIARTNKLMALFRIILLLFLSSCTAVLADVTVEYCSDNLTIPTTQMSANIDSLLAEVASATSKNRFSIATYGKGNDTVYGLGQCRGDVNSTDCSSCIQDAAQSIRTNCQNQTDARLWAENCVLRFAAINFFGKLDTNEVERIFNIDHPQHPSAFKKVVAALMSKISSEAIVPANNGFAKGKITSIPANVTLYGLAQCTMDISRNSCKECLNLAIGNIPKLCKDVKTVGCRVLYSSCYVRYEIYPFYYPLDA